MRPDVRSPQEVADAVASACATGAGWTDVARAAGVSVPAAKRMANQVGYVMNARTSVAVDDIVDMYVARRMSYRAIIAATGLSFPTIHAALDPYVPASERAERKKRKPSS